MSLYCCDDGAQDGTVLDTETGHAIRTDNDNGIKDGSSDAANDYATDNDDGTSLKEQTTQTLDTG